MAASLNPWPLPLAALGALAALHSQSIAWVQRKHMYQKFMEYIICKSVYWCLKCSLPDLGVQLQGHLACRRTRFMKVPNIKMVLKNQRNRRKRFAKFTLFFWPQSRIGKSRSSSRSCLFSACVSQQLFLIPAQSHLESRIKNLS